MSRRSCLTAYFSLPLLGEREGAAGENDAEDGDSVGGVAQEPGKHRRKDQQELDGASNWLR
ncbi:MAG: hypothetical protein U0S12_14975 [Fimbriimonadales bacterium]